MCYYDQLRMGCDCYKWGNFRQHCTREYLTGQTCGMRLVMATYQMEEKCNLCRKLDTKLGRIQKEKDRIRRWKKEKGRTASIDASEEAIDKLEGEINDLYAQRYEQSRMLDSAPRMETSRKITCNDRDQTAVASHDKAGHRQFRLPETSEAPLTGLLAEAIVEEAKMRPDIRREESLSNVTTPESRLSNTPSESLPRQVAKTNTEFGYNSAPSTRRIGHEEHGVRSGLESKALSDAHHGDMVEYSSESWSVEPLVEFAQMAEERSHADDTPWKQAVEITWKCSCGTTFQEQVIEYKPGAAQKLAESVDTGHSIDIERQAGSESWAESSASGSSSSTSSSWSCKRISKCRNNAGVEGDETKEQASAGGHSARGTNKQFILLCRDNGIETRLYHADVSETLCDYSSYHVMHAQHYGQFKGFWRWMTLREILSIEFVKFHLYWETNVSVERKDFGELPPYPSEDYSYTADTNPPVLKTALRHFIEHPSHAPKFPYHRPRIPKKVGEPLFLDKSLDALGAREGYGLYIQERICWRTVFAIEVMFATACMIFAIVWCIKNSGGIQDGFAIAGTGIAYATIILGALQAAAQNHWR